MGLDSAAQGFTPTGIVADMNALRAKLIGLYVFNNDVPSPATVVKGATFVQQVEQLFGSPCVLPIITIRTGDSPTPAFLVQDLLQWFPQAGRHVAHDLENTAFPPLSEVQALFAAEKAAGFSPGIYGFQSTQDSYAAANPDWQWGVQAYAEGFGYLPAPYRMWQWTDNILNGSYDGNTVDDSFSVTFSTFQPPVVGGEEGSVVTGQWNGQLHVLWVDGSGNLHHAWQGPGGNAPPPAWGKETVGTGFSPASLLAVDTSFAQQAHVFVDSGGATTHFFQGSDGAWHSESL